MYCTSADTVVSAYPRPAKPKKMAVPAKKYPNYFFITNSLVKRALYGFNYLKRIELS